MNRHERRAVDAKHSHFLNSLETPLERKAAVVKAKFLADIKTKGTPEMAFGIYGPETRWSDAFVEEVIKPESGGTFIKLYGCSYLYKGIASNALRQVLQFPRYLFSEASREVARLPFVDIGLAFTWFFNRRGFIRFLENLLFNTDNRVTKYYALPEKEYNVFPAEMHRALVWAAVGGGRWQPAIEYAARYIRLFFEVDNTYRLRIQDGLAFADDVFHCLKIMESRETKYGIANKWRFLRYLAYIALSTSPALRRVHKRFFQTLDRTKVKMDDADWYFSLRFKSYDFGGLDFDTREGLWARANKEREHVFLI